MNKFVRNLITEWRKLGLPFADTTIIVAVSGGADSTSLLLAIADLVRRKKLTHRFIVAHFNHKLRGRDSDDDARFVEELAARLGFDCVVGEGRVAKKGNLEQAARNARYKFLLDTAKNHDAFAVLTAHTQNDQAETVLFNLIRGSGPDGLGGMPKMRELADGVLLIRPLLSWAVRSDTESYCNEIGEEFRSDAMNSDERFSRVRIRRTIIPQLAEINPRIVETLARTADLLRTAEIAADACDSQALTLADLKDLSRSHLYTRLRSWLRLTRGNLRSLELKHIESIERLIQSRKSGKAVEIPGGGRVVKHGGELRFENIKVEK